MNAKQQKVLWVAIGLVILISLFPPWKFTLDFPGRMHVEKPGPYGLIFSPPSVPVTDIRYGGLFEGYETQRWTVSIDMARLMTGLGGVSVVAALLLYAFRERPK